MFDYAWPLALVVFSNVVYQVCAKSVPEGMDPLASLTLTYLVASIASAALFYLLGDHASLIKEYGKVNWVPFAFGIVIVGLEVGWIYAYRAGWEVSVGSVVQSAFLAVALLALGYFAYHEPLTWNKVTGVVVILVGLLLMNLK